MSQIAPVADPKQPLLHLYMDETGPRHPDRAAVPTKHGNDWFAIGGVLIRAEDEQKAQDALTIFKKQWP